MELHALIRLLRGHRIFIQTHNFPDPDAIASAYGLQRLLEEFGLSSTICYHGKIERLNALRMLETFHIDAKNISDLPNMTIEDYIITIDSQKYNQNLKDFIGNEVACIDHHPTYIPCQYLYSDIRLVGACSSLIAEYYLENRTLVPKDVATVLAYGIKMDTLDFRRGVTQFDLNIYSRLFPYIDMETLNHLQLNNMEYQDLKAYGAAISNISLHDDLGTAFIPFNCPDALIGMVSDFILSVDEINVSVVYSARQDGYKFSVRSELPDLDAGSLICNALSGIGNGGGHASFAGGFVPQDYIEKSGPDIHRNIRSCFLRELHH